MNTYLYKDPLSLKPISFQDLNYSHEEGIFLRSEIPIKCTRQTPAFVDDPDHCGIFDALTGFPFEYRTPFILSKRQLTLVGQRTFLDQQGYWFNDQGYQEDEYNHDADKLTNTSNAFLNEWTGFSPTSEKGRFEFNFGNRIEENLKGKVLVGCCLEADNYGSWLFRVLPKFNTALKLGLKFDYILVENRLKAFQNFFDLIGVDNSKIIPHDRNKIYRLEHAVIPSLQNIQAYLDPETCEFYRELRAKYGLPCLNEKIFISRLNHAKVSHTTRVLENEKDLVDALRREGFKIVYPELLSLKEQIEVFSSARLVVGPSGSAMFNVVFCHPGTKVIDIESEPHWIHAHTCLFSSLSLNYGIFIGKVDPLDERPVHKRWTVNIPALMNRIHDFDC